jgi:hypothetical protein
MCVKVSVITIGARHIGHSGALPEDNWEAHHPSMQTWCPVW